MMILNFPGNPVPAMAHEDFFKEVISFAKQHNIIVVHDFAYAEFYYDGKNQLASCLFQAQKKLVLRLILYPKAIA